MLEDLIRIAHQAGDKILNVYNNKSIDFTLKGDGSPLTLADKLSNVFIIESLMSKFSIPVISEENILSYEDRRLLNEFWLIDPLDGTKDFIAKNNEFTINIALIKNRRPIVGVLYAPAIGELYFARENEGAFLLKNGKETKLPYLKSEKYKMAKSRFHDSSLVSDFAKMNNITNMSPIGSALKFGKLAAGEINIYPRYSGSKEWDIAAGHVIVKEADCYIVDLETMAEPVYNKPNMKNNFFLACSNNTSLNSFKLPILNEVKVTTR